MAYRAVLDIRVERNPFADLTSSLVRKPSWFLLLLSLVLRKLIKIKSVQLNETIGDTCGLDT